MKMRNYSIEIIDLADEWIENVCLVCCDKRQTGHDQICWENNCLTCRSQTCELISPQPMKDMEFIGVKMDFM